MLSVASVLRRTSMTWVRVYEYPGSNRGVSRGAGNFENRLASEFLTHASSSTAAMVNVISRLKESVLELGRMSCKESF